MAGQQNIADVRSEPAPRIGRGDGSLAVARRLVEAVMSKDRDAVVATLAPEVRFRHLVPRGPKEVWGAAQSADVFLGWFGDAHELEIQSLLVEPIADRTSVRYRVRLREAGGWDVIEQQQFLDMDEEGRIASIDLLCSGFRPDAELHDEGTSGEHRFDAGTMGCADGLAQEFRRRILAIPLGDILEVETMDPAAKEDLPPLARMLGHTVNSIETPGDGRLLIRVERGR
jgi:TusA-related sulfurtransferase